MGKGAGDIRSLHSHKTIGRLRGLPWNDVIQAAMPWAKCQWSILGWGHILLCRSSTRSHGFLQPVSLATGSLEPLMEAWGTGHFFQTLSAAVLEQPGKL